MDETLAVEQVAGDPVRTRETEFVERKGVGHPDSLCDGVAEAVSRRLSQYYRAEFGRVCHHNTDKVHLGAGRADPTFGGGTVVEPIYVLVGGRATASVDGRSVPVADLARAAAREYLLETVPALDGDDLVVETRIGETSDDLASLFERGRRPLANDTSFGVGHAPASPTERFVRTLEPRVREVEAVGADVKLMAARRGDRVALTVAAAVLDGHVAGPAEYRAVTERVAAVAREHAAERLPDGVSVSVAVNAADDYETGSLYLTTTGLSAEAGDDGAVGRGNRTNGLITPHRSMSLEAASGKNPVNHVGKLYNLLAHRVAERLADRGAEFSSVQMLSRIGDPVDQPWAVDVATTLEQRSVVATAVENELDRLEELTDDIVAGAVETF